jgi:UDP-N-acetylglucosamine 2-epimerase (hydrolysing)
MLSKYGSTYREVDKSGIENTYKFINQNSGDSMDQILAKTILGFSDFIKEQKPDLIIVHGDRVEALAGSIVGSMNNIQTAHIEGGEVSGTIDESIRHAISKLAHTHFVANETAKLRLIQLGENLNDIYLIGSPDIDIMNSESLPSIEDVKKYYDIPFEQYGIVLFHSVTTELHDLHDHVRSLVNALINSNHRYIVIYPNNDPGSDLILQEYERLRNHESFKIFPSMRFEYFLSALKNADFIIGNSSAGIREAPHYGIHTINLGTRQNRRNSDPEIVNMMFDSDGIKNKILEILKIKRPKSSNFGTGDSVNKFYQALCSEDFWDKNIQKSFNDQF